MKRNIFVIFLFILLILAITYPLVFSLNTSIPASIYSDENLAPLWDSWRMKYSLDNGLSLKEGNLLVYPWGMTFFNPQTSSYVWFIINFLLSILTAPALTYNLQVLLNMFLALLFMYFLVYRLIKDRLAAFFSAIIFGFSPYMLIRSWQHLGETYIWPIPLLLLGLIGLRDEDKLKHKLIVILSVLFGLANFYVTYYLSLVFIIFIIFSLGDLANNRAYFKRLSLIVLILIALIIPMILPILIKLFSANKDMISSFNPYRRDFKDLFVQAAKPLSYLLPPATHPVFGKITEQFLGSRLYGINFTENTLYLGWTTIVLAFLGVKQWFRLKKEKNWTNSYIGLFFILAIIAWLFSQAPWWDLGLFKVYLPSFFMFKILPVFRAYCRFGVVVLFSFAVLAGFGLKFILERFKSKFIRGLSTIGFSILILFEFWPYPPYKVLDIAKVPEVYYWLKIQPKETIIAEYPLDLNTPNEKYKFYQTIHQKRLINCNSYNIKAKAIAQQISQLSDLKTAGILRGLGVKYVIIHGKDYMINDLNEPSQELALIAKNPGLKFVKKFSSEIIRQGELSLKEGADIDVYEVVASPVKIDIIL